MAADDLVRVACAVPPPAPTPYVQTLRRAHTCDELRRRLSRTDGSKSDLALRLAKKESGVLTAQEVGAQYTVVALRRRLKSLGAPTAGSKAALVSRLLHETAHFEDGPAPS